MIKSSHFNLASVSENSILIILKSTQVSKAAGLDSLSGRFLKDGAKFLAKTISDLCNLSINAEKLPAPCIYYTLTNLVFQKNIPKIFAFLIWMTK